MGHLNTNSYNCKQINVHIYRMDWRRLGSVYGCEDSEQQLQAYLLTRENYYMLRNNVRIVSGEFKIKKCLQPPFRNVS